MSRLKALREKGATQAKSIRALADKMNAEGYVPSAEDEANWKAVNADYDATAAAIEREARAEKLATIETPDPVAVSTLLADPARARGDGSETATTDAQRTLALAGWLAAFSPRGMTEQQAAACRSVGLNPLSKEIGFSLYGTEDYRTLQSRWRKCHPDQAAERNADFRATLSTGSGSGGGYLIAPEQLRTSLEINMLAYGGMRQVAETIRTSSGEPLSWPTADDTSNTGAQLGESTTIGSSVDPSFAKVFWYAYKYSSKPILVPYELIQDSVFNLPGLLGQMLGERLGRITNTRFTTGDGAAKPKGIVTASTSFSAASATAIAADDLLGLVHSIDPAYRTSGCGFMMHDAIVLILRKLKDGNGQYLWEPGIQAGQPNTILGRPYAMSEYAPNTFTTGLYVAICGDFSAYWILDSLAVEIQRLEELLTLRNQVGFLGRKETDGMPVLEEAFSRLKLG